MAETTDKRTTCYMCLCKIPITLRIRRFVANHEVCDDCYASVCGYVDNKRLQKQQANSDRAKKAVELIPRCMVTGNPCNTDTRSVNSDWCCPRCEAEYYKSKLLETEKLTKTIFQFNFIDVDLLSKEIYRAVDILGKIQDIAGENL